MSFKRNSFLVIAVLLVVTQFTEAGRLARSNGKNADMRQSAFLFGKGGYIPGFGFFMPPPFFTPGGDDSTAPATVVPPISSTSVDGTTAQASGPSASSVMPPVPYSAGWEDIGIAPNGARAAGGN